LAASVVARPRRVKLAPRQAADAHGLPADAPVDIAQAMSRDEPAPTRERIRAVAAELYVTRGYEGFSFGDIAAAVGTTRANIHHHFGSKSRLVAELVDGFAADATERVHRSWVEADVSFFDRFDLQLEDLRTFYTRFNRRTGDRNVWSPLSRLRLDLQPLGSVAADALGQVSEAFDASIRQAVARAMAAGELRADTPVEEVALILRTTLMSCGPITQDSGSFAEVERLFTALRRTIAAAWVAR
jgi:AcrR family transcriptional regulator